MSLQLSVVVPFYNVEPYLRVCLESLARQTLRDLEVIMVDDGSTDGGPAIAKEFAARDPRFRLVQQPNQGLGPARNAGVPEATGTYLAFADSDDVIPRYAYELMVSSLAETGSDLACGGVRRIGAEGLTGSPMHRDIFQITRRGTHVRRFPELLNDRTAWNKVFRRSFWDRHCFAFPPGLYEDIPVTIPAHTLAGSVDVLREPVYHWRIREAGTRSITQRRTDPGNLADRIRSVRAAADFLAGHDPELKKRYDRYALSDDIRIFVNVVDQGDEAYRQTFLELVNGYLDGVDPARYRELPAIERLKFHAVRQRLMPELVRIVSFAKSDPRRHSALRRDGGWYGDYPFLGDPRFPDHLYELSEEHELKPKTGIDEVSWRDGRLRVEGHAYIDRLDAPARDDTRIEVELRRRLLVLPKVVRPKAERRRRPDVTAASGQATACHDWSGFAFELDPGKLGTLRGTWHIFVTVTTHGVTRRTRLTGPKGVGLWPPARELPGGLRVTPKYDQSDHLQIGVHPIRAQVTGAQVVGGDTIEFTGWARKEDAGFVTGGELAVSFRQGRTTVSRPLTVTGTQGRQVAFTARLPLAELGEQTGVDGGSGSAQQANDTIDWDVFLAKKGGGKLRLAVQADLSEARASVGGHEYHVIGTKFGNLSLVERAPRLVVTGIDWLEARAVRLTGSCTDPGTRPDRLVLRRRKTSDAHECPVIWEGDRFTAMVIAERRTLEGVRPLPSGWWELFTQGPAGDSAVGIDRGIRDRLPEPRNAGVHELALMAYRADLLRLRIRPALCDDERGPYKQRQLQRRFFGAGNGAPIRDLVVFESYFGRQYSCNPKAIYEEMVRRDLGLEYVWSTADGQFRAPRGARTVLRGSTDYYEAVASARVIVNNCLQMPGYAKRPGQLYLQTWHGTPYKHIAYDLVRNGSIASGTTKLDRYVEDVPLWDLLLSSGPQVTRMLRKAFEYDGEAVEAGYPRNDLLFGADRARRAAEVRARLGVPADRKVALYVPTWREDIWLTKGRVAELVLDAGRVAAACGDEYALLVRQHHMVADRTVGIGAGVIDVTRYPEIGELFLIADVIITDYSSVMFDFAATGRPILFFTPDLDFYAGELRGVYFDLISEAPGPLLRETGEVIAALRDLAAVQAAHRTAYAAFRDRYCPCDDGRAAARVVDRLLG